MTRHRFVFLALVGLVTGGAILAATLRPVGDVRPTRPTTTTTVAPLRWTNPVLAADFPDPFLLRDGNRYMAFATNGPAGRVQVSTSEDLATWSAPTEALASMPTWASARNDLVWAPAVGRFDSTWVMYATFPDARSGRQCIGVATSPTSTGPYTPVTGAPLVCPVADGGAIDPDVFSDGEAVWLLWKVDGNCCGRPSTIRSQQLAADGRSLVGSASDLLTVDQTWERGAGARQSTVEGPSLRRIDGRLFLLYSGGGYAGAGYATGFAVCESVRGPCHKPRSTPLIASTTTAAGPGGGSLFLDEERRPWVAYHAWDPAKVGYEAGGVRSMRLDRLLVVDGQLVVLGPTTSPMELPARAQVPVVVTTSPTTAPSSERSSVPASSGRSEKRR